MTTADLRDDDDDPFLILGVSRNCTASELKQVYRLLARRYHPDVNPGPEASAQMKRINLAYNRALAQVERTTRLRSARASAMTVATQQPSPPSAGLARVFGSNVRIARAAIPRRGHRRALTLWLSGITSVAIAALIILVVFRALRPASSAPTDALGGRLPTLRLNAAAAFNWQDAGDVAISERLIAQLPPGFHLNEAPEWSHDGAYVAISVTPDGGAGSTASDASEILVAQGAHVLATLPGTSARWSPVTNQLAVLTAPGAGNAPLLELFALPTSSASAHTVLDSGAATHLAWSADGTQIAYSANGQQQLRLTDVSRGAPRTLVKTHGQRLIPLGWLGGQIVEIDHNSGAISLVGVDPLHKHSTILADLDALASETTVTVSRGGVAYLTKTQASPFVTFHWLASHQGWRAELPGVQDVRFLAGWSEVGDWMALAPIASSATAGAGASEICFAREPHAAIGALANWPLRCLLIPGSLEGMSWEPHSSTLSYVRQTPSGGRLELRALHIQSGLALATSGQDVAVQEGSSDPLSPTHRGGFQARRDVRQGEPA